MRQRKVYQLLLLFDPQDLKGFQAYLSNTYFNQSKTLVDFFVRFRKKVLDPPNGADCTVEAFLAGTNITRRRMDKLCSRLYGMASSYLALKAFESNEDARDDMLLEAIGQREISSRESMRMYERLRSQNDDKQDSPDNMLRALHLRWRHAEVAIKARETRQLWREDFQDLHDLLDQYYQLQKLKLLSASANAKNIFNHDERDPGSAFLEALQSSHADAALTPLARAYYLTIRMIQAEDGESFFQELLPLLGKMAPRFAPSEAMELYGYALNFCIRSSNQGRLEYLKHASALYQQLLNNKLILENGEIWPQQFKNIVALHCRLGMVDWVRTFIDDFAAYLPQESKKDALMYNEAILSFYQGAYASAIRRFKQIIADLTDDVFYGIDARVYLWKSYFEIHHDLSMEEVDDMHRLYDSFRLYIERNEKISAAHKQHYRNFIREFKRFMEILRGDPVDKASLEALRQDVSEMEFVSNKGWFLEKIGKVLADLRS